MLGRDWGGEGPLWTSYGGVEMDDDRQKRKTGRIGGRKSRKSLGG